MLLIFALQLLLPLVAAFTLLLWPQRSFVALSLQMCAAALVIAAVTAIGIWLFPPWWVAELTTVVLVIGILRAIYYTGVSSIKPASPSAWIAAFIYLSFGVTAYAFLQDARLGQYPPEWPAAVDIYPPLPAGDYLVVNGGNALAINAHQLSLDTAIMRLRPWRGNAHALDIVSIDRLGMRASGVRPASPERYRIFGVAVLSPCNGAIKKAYDGLPDMKVPERDNKHPAGNHLIIECKGINLVLAHFQRGSLRVKSGDTVSSGQWLANVGNSGGSDEPHLHIHAQTAGPKQAPFAGDPIPIRILRRYMIRGDRFSVH